MKSPRWFRSSLLLLLIAGLRLGDAQTRTIGGKDAPEGSAPYQISLRVDGEHVCGGALISRSWLLTAAHCVLKHGLQNLVAVLGTHDLILGNGREFTLAEARIHPDYEPRHHQHDLALLRLGVPIDTGLNAVAPVDLPKHSTPDTCGRHRPCPVGNFTGWPSRPAIGRMQLLQLPLINVNDCQSIFPSVSDKDNVCTLELEGQGLCYGDAGSPLVIDGYLIAIGSWGSPCVRGYPDVHIRVYSHVRWIKSIVGREL